MNCSGYLESLKNLVGLRCGLLMEAYQRVLRHKNENFFIHILWKNTVIYPNEYFDVQSLLMYSQLCLIRTGLIRTLLIRIKLSGHLKIYEAKDLYNSNLCTIQIRTFRNSNISTILQRVVSSEFLLHFYGELNAYWSTE